jgi:chromosomal replication initiator protein
VSSPFTLLLTSYSFSCKKEGLRDKDWLNLELFCLAAEDYISMNGNFPFGHFLNVNKKADVPVSNINPTAHSPELQELKDELSTMLKENIGSDKYKTLFEHSFQLQRIENQTLFFSASTQLIRDKVKQMGLPELVKLYCLNKYNQHFDVLVNISEKPNTKSLSSNSHNILNALQPSHKEEEKTSYTPPIPNHPNFHNKSAKDSSFTLELSNTSDDLRNKVESKYIGHMNPVQSSLTIDPSKTFDNFIVGPSNNLAFATALAVADGPGNKGKYPSLYFYSTSGLGKTHLLHAVGNSIKENFPELVICLITARDFMKEMISAIQNKDLPRFQKKYSETIDVLLIDDIHELNNKKGTQNEFFHIFNELYQKGKQLIFTSDKSPSEIEGIEERIKTRLGWGLVVDIQRPDLETRMAILKKKANSLDLYIPEEVYFIMANSIKTSIRELEGALIKLSAFSDVMKMEIDAEMVKKLLQLDNIQKEKIVDLHQIGKMTAQYYKIPLPDLRSRARSKEITLARHIAMYLSRKIINATQQEIGEFFGGRDHSSVIHGVNKVTQALKNNPSLSQDISVIENTL